MMSNSILSIQDLKVRYGNIEALKGVNIDVKEGKVVSILGANGAGKTSLLRTISGLVSPQSGTIQFMGKEIAKLDAEKIAALGIAQSPEGRQIFRDLTVEENLRIGSFTVKNKAEVEKNYQRVFKYFPILKERKNQVASTLSGGEQQMLAIGRALMGSPKVLLLDEPSLGLAPLIVRDIFKIIKEIQAEGATVIIVEQNAKSTLKIADYAYVIELGEISMEGEAQELLHNPKLIEAYLGSSEGV